MVATRKKKQKVQRRMADMRPTREFVKDLGRQLPIIEITIEVAQGTTLGVAAHEAIRISEILSCGVRFDFNGYSVCGVWPDDKPEFLVARYHELWSRQNGKPVEVQAR